MTPADLALDSAIHFEGVKVAYRQTKDGVVISFVVHPHDVPKGLAEAPLGSRYIVALVQVGDDEQAIQTKEVMPNPHPQSAIDAQPQPAEPDRHPAGAKRTASGDSATQSGFAPRRASSRMDWRELHAVVQAGIRCDDAIFEAFLREQYPDDWEACEHDAAEVVRFICGINSRAELGIKHAARMIWKQLDEQFLTWKLKERAGA